MPIINYERLANRNREKLFNSENISQKNKNILLKFLEVYNVSPATKAKFYDHIRFLLEKIDLQKDLKNRDKINRIFSEIRLEAAPGYLGCLIEVSKRLARWLNDGELPKGFKDLKTISEKQKKRDLSHEDMWTWEDGKNVANFSTSIQIKAAILTQLDAGLRPSEFVDLNYGDVIVKKDIIILQIRKGKTGARPVPCQRCVPYLLRWYSQHPTKKENDPLWITEFKDKSHIKDEPQQQYKIRRYNYAALLKRIRTLAEKVGLKKPCDFYNFRHSSCVLDKLDNLPLDVAASRHGHSTEYFTNIYGRLDLNDLANRMRKHYGSKEEIRKPEKSVICERCDMANELDATICSKCTSPLSLKVALEMEKEKDAQMKQMIADQVSLILEKKAV